MSTNAPGASERPEGAAADLDLAAMVTNAPRMVLYGRAGCHLCEEARSLVAAVSADTGAAWAEIDVDDDAELAERYSDLVPVVTVDGVQQGYWRIDAERLRRALAAGDPG